VTWWDLRRLLRDLARAANRWRLVEATCGPGAAGRRAIVDDGDTGLWHTLDTYTGLTVARPTLPIGMATTRPSGARPR